MNNFQKLLFGLATLCLLLAVFSIVVISRSTLFPFIVGKYVFFRSMVSASLVFYLILLITGWRPRPERFSFMKSPIFIAVSSFAGFFILSGFLGVDPANSFWSNFERGEGSYAMVYYFLFFFLALLILEKEKDWEKIFQASILAGILMVFYGFAQKLDIEGVVNIGVGLYGRMQGSLGNPAYVSVYLFFASFYAFYLLSREKNIWKKIFYFFAIFVFAAGFILAETRGAFLGLALATLLVTIFFFFRIPNRRFRVIYGTGLIFLVIVGSTLFYFRDLEFVQKLPASRLLYLSLSERTAQTRFWTWGSAWQGFLERPTMGWGPENFPWVFDKYFDVRHFSGINVPSETWFDRAHSIYLDYLTEIGLIGFLSFLSIFALIFYNTLFRIRFENVYQQALIFALPIAYLGQGTLLFDVLPVYFNLFLFWAFMVYKSSTSIADKN